MVRKETIRKMVDMHAPASRSFLDRDRAVDRIRRLTVGTTVAGIVGIGAFGGLAATTWRGTDTTVTTAAVITTTGDDAASGAGSSTSSDDGTSTVTDDTTATPSPTATANTQATTPTVTATGGAAHATTGSS